MLTGRRGLGDRHLRSVFYIGAVGGLTDGELLSRFASCGGETAELAFAALVQRHRPMVLRVCRSILRDEDAAEDALQATFLILVHRAGTVPTQLGGELAPRSGAPSRGLRRGSTSRRRIHKRGPPCSRPLNLLPFGTIPTSLRCFTKSSAACRSDTALC